MARKVQIEEFHVTVFIPRQLDQTDQKKVRRILVSREFRAQLQKAVVSVFHRHPNLARTQVLLSR